MPLPVGIMELVPTSKMPHPQAQAPALDGRRQAQRASAASAGNADRNETDERFKGKRELEGWDARGTPAALGRRA